MGQSRRGEQPQALAPLSIDEPSLAAEELSHHTMQRMLTAMFPPLPQIFTGPVIGCTQSSGVPSQGDDCAVEAFTVRRNCFPLRLARYLTQPGWRRPTTPPSMAILDELVVPTAQHHLRTPPSVFQPSQPTWYHLSCGAVRALREFATVHLQQLWPAFVLVAETPSLRSASEPNPPDVFPVRTRSFRVSRGCQPTSMPPAEARLGGASPTVGPHVNASTAQLLPTVAVPVEVVVFRIMVHSTSPALDKALSDAAKSYNQEQRQRYPQGDGAVPCLTSQSWLWVGKCWERESDAHVAATLNLMPRSRGTRTTSSASSACLLVAALYPGMALDVDHLVSLRLSKWWEVTGADALANLTHADHMRGPPEWGLSGHPCGIAIPITDTEGTLSGPSTTPSGILTPRNYNAISGAPLAQYAERDASGIRPMLSTYKQRREGTALNPFQVASASRQVCWIPQAALTAHGLGISRRAQQSPTGSLLGDNAAGEECVARLQQDMYLCGAFFSQLPAWWTEYFTAAVQALGDSEGPAGSISEDALERLLSHATPSSERVSESSEDQRGPLVYVLMHTPSAEADADAGLTWRSFSAEDVYLNFLYRVEVASLGFNGRDRDAPECLLSQRVLQYLLHASGLPYCTTAAYFLELRAALRILGTACDTAGTRHALSDYLTSMQQQARDSGDVMGTDERLGVACHGTAAHFTQFMMANCRRQQTWSLTEWDDWTGRMLPLEEEEVGREYDDGDERNRSDPTDATLPGEEGGVDTTDSAHRNGLPPTVGATGGKTSSTEDLCEEYTARFLAQFELRSAEDSVKDALPDPMKWERSRDGPDMPAVDRRHFGPGSRMEDPSIPDYVQRHRETQPAAKYLGAARTEAVANAFARSREERLLLSRSQSVALHAVIDDSAFPLDASQGLRAERSLETRQRATCEAKHTPSVGVVEHLLRCERRRQEERWQPWLRQLESSSDFELWALQGRRTVLEHLLTYPSPNKVKMAADGGGDAVTSPSCGSATPDGPFANDGSTAVTGVPGGLPSPLKHRGVCSWDLGVEVLCISYVEKFVNASNTVFKA